MLKYFNCFEELGSIKWYSERRDWNYGVKYNVKDYILLSCYHREDCTFTIEKIVHLQHTSFLSHLKSLPSQCLLLRLFNFHCDLSFAVFVVLGTCIAVQLGTNPDWMFFCCFAGTFMFYCAHWQTYVSGTLRFGM